LARKQQRNTKDWIYSPEKIDFKALGVPDELEIHCRWMLNCVYFNHVVFNLDRDAYTPLHSDLLAQVFGRRNLVVPVRRACLEAGLLEIDGDEANYQPGVRSLSYRLGPALRDVKFVRYSIPGKRFADRVAAFRGYKAKNGPLDAVSTHLRGWVERLRLAPNFEDVIATIDDETKRDLAREQTRVIFDDGIVRSKRCEFGRRFHANTTGLVSEVRHGALSFDGETPLIEIDVVNSQPYQLACIIVQAGVEASAFVDDVLTGELYSRFQEVGGFASRGEAKQGFFFEVYGQTWRETPIIATLYPEVATFVRELKRQRGYKEAPRRMQRRESDVMIDRVCGRLMAEHPEVGIITCHDSILCQPDDVEIVTSVLRWGLSDNPFQPQLRVG